MCIPRDALQDYSSDEEPQSQLVRLLAGPAAEHVRRDARARLQDAFGALKRGWLMKHTRNWRRRYVMMLPDRLVYFESIPVRAVLCTAMAYALTMPLFSFACVLTGHQARHGTSAQGHGVCVRARVRGH